VQSAFRCAGDKNWYRAVLLETTETEASVIYADYGNSEKLPFASILPIPTKFLELPFQIARCALTGKEHFPSVWPVEVLELFSALLSDGVLASVQAFDGNSNLLSVTLQIERGGGHLNAMILEGLQSTQTGSAKTSTPRQEPGQTKTPIIVTAPVTPATAPVTPATAPVTVSGYAAPKNTEPKEPQSLTCSKSVNDYTSPCCCQDLVQKIDQLEEHILFLMKQIGGWSK
uniref:Tudor domain-containing protein n=1 Tax=Hucho hucho TaxID=62062 RepID=A0A4W5QCD0_9TELE